MNQFFIYQPHSWVQINATGHSDTVKTHGAFRTSRTACLCRESGNSLHLLTAALHATTHTAHKPLLTTPPVFLVTVGRATLHWKRSSHCQMSEAVLISHFGRVSASRQHPRWWLRLHTPRFVWSSRVCPQISSKAARFGLIIISAD